MEHDIQIIKRIEVRANNKPLAGSTRIGKNKTTNSGAQRICALSLLVALACTLLLVMLASLVSSSAEASALSSVAQQELHHSPGSISAASANGMTGAGYNNLDNLISDFLDDAGNRLKKSKLNSMRQIKPTLRFGRRSDPMLAPSLADQLASMEGEEKYELNQRRLLAAALAAAADN